MNVANMANIALVRDAVRTGADATRGIPGQYPADHGLSDSETSDSEESAPSVTEPDGSDAAAAVA